MFTRQTVDGPGGQGLAYERGGDARRLSKGCKTSNFGLS